VVGFDPFPFGIFGYFLSVCTDSKTPQLFFNGRNFDAPVDCRVAGLVDETIYLVNNPG
jgi:hypothetical protein